MSERFAVGEPPSQSVLMILLYRDGAVGYLVAMYKVAYSKKALRDIRNIPENEARRIRAKIDDYAKDATTQVHHVKKLKGREGYRLRVGNWRVIFDVDGTVMGVLEVGARGNIYG